MPRPHTASVLEDNVPSDISSPVPVDSPASPMSGGSDTLPALSTRPRTSGLKESEDSTKERSRQPTLEDLGRALRERRQVHAWIDLEMQDSAVEGLAEAFENLKDRVNSWSAVKSLTDFKLSTEYEIKQPAFRREMMKRIKPLASMKSPLSSNRPLNSAPQTGTEPRLLGGIADVAVKNFPPVGPRGTISTEIVASYPFRLCGDEWSIDLACNKHWVKLGLCYKGSKPCVDRITSAWFRSEGEDAPLQYIFEPKQRLYETGKTSSASSCCWATKTLQTHFHDGVATLRIQILEGGNC